MCFVYIPLYSTIFHFIHNLFAFLHEPWLMVGNFNDKIHHYEKLDSQSVYFNDNNWLINFMYSIGFVDLDNTSS